MRCNAMMIQATPPPSPQKTSHLLVLSESFEVTLHHAVYLMEGSEAPRPEEHLSHQWATNAGVKPREALPLVCLFHTVDSVRVEGVAAGGLGLKANLDGVKRVTDESHSYTTKNPSDVIYWNRGVGGGRKGVSTFDSRQYI